MTKEEALFGVVVSRALSYAVNSNMYAREAELILANSNTNSVEFYTKWLVNNGHDVDLEIVEENGLRRVNTLTVDGRAMVKNGVYAYSAR